MTIKQTVINAVGTMPERFTVMQLTAVVQSVDLDITEDQVKRALRDLPYVIKMGKACRVKGRAVKK